MEGDWIHLKKNSHIFAKDHIFFGKQVNFLVFLSFQKRGLLLKERIGSFQSSP